MTKDSYDTGNASDPAVTANVVSQAVKAGKPKTRYAVDNMAKPLMFARKFLGDRIFDKLITSVG